MVDIKFQIENIKTVVNALLESKALPDCFGLRSSQDFQGNNEFYLEVHIGKWESEDFTNYRDTTIELKIWDTEEELKNAKDDIVKLADTEGLTAHANSIKGRFE